MTLARKSITPDVFRDKFPSHWSIPDCRSMLPLSSICPRWLGVAVGADVAVISAAPKLRRQSALDLGVARVETRHPVETRVVTRFGGDDACAGNRVGEVVVGAGRVVDTVAAGATRGATFKCNELLNEAVAARQQHSAAVQQRQ
jgi:hypothetical protein